MNEFSTLIAPTDIIAAWMCLWHWSQITNQFYCRQRVEKNLTHGISNKHSKKCKSRWCTIYALVCSQKLQCYNSFVMADMKLPWSCTVRRQEYVSPLLCLFLVSSTQFRVFNWIHASRAIFAYAIKKTENLRSINRTCPICWVRTRF